MRLSYFALGIAVVAALQSGAMIARPNPHAKTVASWLRQYHKGSLRDRNDRPVYRAAYTDLNGDGVDEALVYFESRGTCGSGGCNLYVLASRDGFWRRVSGHTIVRLPVQVLTSRHHGWKDLSVFVAGGGILPGYSAVLPFDGKTYPLNPTMPPAHPAASNVGASVLIDAKTKPLPLR